MQSTVEISSRSALSSMDHLAQGEKSTSSRIGQLFLSAGFLICKSRSYSPLTFDESKSKKAQLLYDSDSVCSCISYRITKYIHAIAIQPVGQKKRLILC